MPRCNHSYISQTREPLYKDWFFQLRLEELAEIGLVHGFTKQLVEQADYSSFAALFHLTVGFRFL